ncbi:MAG: hypothetical protein J6A95_06640 [Clostridia bacterium]|nr:hypothetical protein [Clostridia bacterium]
MIKKKYIFAIIAVLMCLAFCLTGCKKTYQAGNFSFAWLSSPVPSMGIKSDTNKFSKDDVTFDLYLGLYDLNSREAPREQYYNPINGNLVFVIYAYGEEDFHRQSATEIYDYTKRDNRHYIMHIDEEQAFTEEYCFVNSSKNGIVYKQKGIPITIPKNVFDSQNNLFRIALAVYVQDEDSGEYKSIGGEEITLGYKFLSKHEVKIDFSPLD